MEKQLPSSQEEQEGDKVQSVIEENTKSGFRKFHPAQEWYKLAGSAKRVVKVMTESVVGRFQYHHHPGTSSKAENIYRTAGSLYICWLSCKDAFPSSPTQDEWVEDAWNQACLKTGAHPNSLRQDEEIKCSSMKFFTDMKTKIKSAVESSYEFDTSPSPQSITRNANRAQALLAKTTFIHREFNFGGYPCHPYQHPIFLDIIVDTWFKNRDDIGVVFREHFDPIPFEVIALAATVIECCIDEWFTGTCNESSWKEVRYKTKYFSHLNFLRDLDARSPHQEGRDSLRRIQDDLLRAARIRAGAPPDVAPPVGQGGSP